LLQCTLSTKYFCQHQIIVMRKAVPNNYHSVHHTYFQAFCNKIDDGCQLLIKI